MENNFATTIRFAQAEVTLPEGWEKSKLREISTISDRDHKTPVYTDDGVILISPKNFTRSGIDFTTLKHVHSDELVSFERKCRPEIGDILYSRIGTIGEARLVDFEEKYVALHSIALIKPNIDLVQSKFLLYYLKSNEIKLQAMGDVKSIGTPDLGLEKIKEFSIRLPPLPEQRRIIAQLEALLADVERVRGRLEAVAATMQRFRQAVLAAALEGRLSEDWREDRPVGDVQTLLNECVRQREALWRLSTEKHGKRSGKYPRPFDIESPLVSLPEGWTNATLSQLVFFDVGFAFKSEEFTDEGIRLLRGENIKPGSIDWEKTRFISRDRCQEYAQFLLEDGDIVLGMDRPLISSGLKIARVRKSDLPCLLVQRVMRFRFVKKELREFVFLCLLHSAFADSIKRGGLTGSDLPHITGDSVPKFVIPLPPLPEQHEIVRRVDALFALADRIEGEVSGALERVEALREAVLAKAFRGELVPTEAELARREGRAYEPAAVLLERVRAGRTIPVKSPRLRKNAGTVTLEAFGE